MIGQWPVSARQLRAWRLATARCPVDRHASRRGRASRNMPENACSHTVRGAQRRGQLVSRPMSQAVLHTSAGPVAIELFDADAPKTVENFRKLAADGFYDGLVFHRVIPDFMIQGGCPEGTGRGGPGYTFEDEINDHKIVRGALAMANSGPDTNGSQFFVVTTQEAPWLDGKHTVFGRVTDGMNTVDTIESAKTDAQDRPVDAQAIERVELRD
jgi:peptidyl-prolyl cis-trans isomerase B (cyclophilin B)